MTKVELLRKMLNWCKEFNRDHFKDTPSFITAIMPLVNQEPDDEWEKRVKTAMIEWRATRRSSLVRSMSMKIPTWRCIACSTALW